MKQVQIICNLYLLNQLLTVNLSIGQEGTFSLRVYTSKPIKLKLIDCIPAIVKPAITKAPISFDQKFAQYEALFMQLADEVSYTFCIVRKNLK